MVYYNTTTEPTYYFQSHLNFWTVVLNSIAFFSITAVASESLLHWIKYSDFGGKIGEDESESESEDEEGEEGDYTAKYTEDYTNLKERELSEDDLLTLNTRYVKEETPGGEVVMSYDKDTGCFSYYTDNLKEITYAILETVARKFVVANDCKTIYTICKKAAAATATATTRAAESDDDAVSSDEEVVVEKPISVFAKFKKYNTGGKGSVPNFKAVIDVVEQTNHFRFKGKLYEYEEIQKRNEAKRNEAERNEAEPTKNLDYAAYKKQLLEKTKKTD